MERGLTRQRERREGRGRRLRVGLLLGKPKGESAAEGKLGHAELESGARPRKEARLSGPNAR